MNYQDMDLQRSYISKGDNNFADDFNPVLSCTKEYKRSVGFYIQCFDSHRRSIIDLARNGELSNLLPALGYQKRMLKPFA